MLSNDEISVTVRSYWNQPEASLIAELQRLNNRTAMDLARDIFKAAPTQKIQNIKTLRERCSLGLKEAKDMIDQVEVETLEARLFELVRNNRSIVLSTFQMHDYSLVDTSGPPF